MIVDGLNPRERRVVAVGLFLVLLLLLVFGVVNPYLAQYTLYRDTIDDQLFRLSRLQQAAAQLPLLEAEIQALREGDRTQDLTWNQATPALAAAQMQQHFGRMVADNGGEVRSVQVGNPEPEEGGFTRLSMRVRMTGTGENLIGLFSYIEAYRPLMLIHSVQARIVQPRRRSRAVAADPGQVHLDFELLAFMRVAAPS